MFPAVIFLVPLFILMRWLGLVNTHGSLILTYLTFGLPLAIWLLKGFYDNIPIQLEQAARIDGASEWLILRRIVLPQAMRAIVPPAANMLIGTLKGTSIVSVIAVHDLLYSVQLIYNRNYLVIPLLLVATVWYLIVTSLLTIGQYYVERHYSRGARRESAPTPWQRLRGALIGGR